MLQDSHAAVPASSEFYVEQQQYVNSPSRMHDVSYDGHEWLKFMARQQKFLMNKEQKVQELKERQSQKPKAKVGVGCHVKLSHVCRQPFDWLTRQ